VANAHPDDILTLGQDSFTEALARLDPASRALLDLSLRRGMRPEEIGDLLGTDPESVIVAREQALEQLAEDVGVRSGDSLDDLRARLAELPGAAWTPDLADSFTEEEPPKATEAPPARRRSRLPLLLALAAVAVVALIVALASGGGDEEPAPSPGAQQPDPQPSPEAKPDPAPRAEPTPPPVKLNALSGRATGTARVTGRRLDLRVKGLPKPPRGGFYQVWLYDSVIDSRAISRARKGRFRLRARLPRSAARYAFLDVSRERADGNRNHSGVSVMRVPVAKLTG
jgi:hypothetical protein